MPAFAPLLIPAMDVIRVYLHRRKFDYAVLTGGHPGGLYVEHDKRTVKFKFKCHYLLFSRISGAGGLL